MVRPGQAASPPAARPRHLPCHRIDSAISSGVMAWISSPAGASTASRAACPAPSAASRAASVANLRRAADKGDMRRPRADRHPQRRLVALALRRHHDERARLASSANPSCSASTCGAARPAPARPASGADRTAPPDRPAPAPPARRRRSPAAAAAAPAPRRRPSTRARAAVARKAHARTFVARLHPLGFQQVLGPQRDELRLARAPIAASAAFATADRAQPPPTQPSRMVPSSRTSALAPGLAEVASTVRTIVATAKARPSALQTGRSASRSVCGRRRKAS